MEDRKFYVYCYFRLDGSPLYLGKGQGSRAREHLKVSCNSQLNRYIAKYGEPPIVILRDGLLEAEAYDTEIELIAAIGRGKFGPLVNVTAGGDGLRSPSDEVRLKMRMARLGKPQPDSAKLKNSAAHTGMKRPEGTGGRISAALKGKKRAPLTGEVKAKISAAQLGKVVPPEVGAKISAAKVGKKRAPFSVEHRAKTSAAMKGRSFSPEHLANLKAAAERRKGH